MQAKTSRNGYDNREAVVQADGLRQLESVQVATTRISSGLDLPDLQIRLLGDFSLEYKGRPLHHVNTPRLQSLLAYLVLHRQAVQIRQHVAFLLWPDSSEAQARTNLRNLLHLLRRALPDADRYLRIDTLNVQWQAKSLFTLDIAQFESCAAQTSSKQALQRAVELYRGDLLPSCYDDWILPERERLRQLYQQTLERLFELCKREHDYPAAIRYVQCLLQHDLVHEPGYLALMDLYMRSGDRAAALRTYQTCKTVLRRELEVEPGAAIRELYECLSAEDGSQRTLTEREIVFGLGRLDGLLRQRAPRLQSRFERLATALHEALRMTSGGSVKKAEDDRQQILGELDVLCEEVLALSFQALALGRTPDEYDGRCPFRGLYPFHAEDREFFFGREVLVQQLRRRLDTSHFLALVGPSGCGKSSLVLAGLVPALQQCHPDLSIAYLTPGNDPLAQLNAGLQTWSAGSEGTRGTQEMEAMEGSDHSSLVIVDQFEELFTLCTIEADRQAFIDHLLALTETTWVVITMRSDFYSECARYPELKVMVQVHQELIAPMDTVELHRAIQMQAAKVGLRFESDLSRRIVDDVSREPGAMPLLQHALLELWQRRHGCWLLIDEYRDLGGVQRAIAHTADAVYAQLSPGEQERVGDIFLRLTRLDDDPLPGEERRDTRRRVSLAELVPAGSDPAATRSLVKRLADVRLVVTSQNKVGGEQEVEVTHEALIRYWPRLRTRLDQDWAALRLRETVRQAALDWDTGQREESLLIHRGTRLDEATEFSRQRRLALNEREQAYIATCLALRERQKAEEEAQRHRDLIIAQQLAQEAEARRGAEEQARREAEARAEERTQAARRLRQRARYLIALSAVAASAAISAVGAAWVARIAQQQAEAERNRAQAQSILVSAREWSEVAASHLEDDPELSVLLSKPALLTTYQRDRTVLPEAVSALHQALQTSRVLRTLVGPEGNVSGVAFSPDGQHLATAHADFSARIWDTTTGQQLFVLQGHAKLVYTILWFPGGRQLATASADGTVKLWNMTSTEPGSVITPALTLIGDGSEIRNLAIDPTGHRLAAASFNGTILIWNIIPGQGGIINTPDRVIHSSGRRLASLVFSPDGKRLAVAGEEPAVKIWDITTGELLLTLTGHQTIVWSVAFSPDGQRLATASQDETIRIWDISPKHRDEPSDTSRVLTGHANSVYAVAFSPDGQYLVSGGADDVAKIWDVASGKEVLTLSGHHDNVIAVAFSPDGQEVATGSEDQTAKIWDISPGHNRLLFTGHTNAVRDIAFSPDGARLASASWDGTARIWDAASAEPVLVLPAHQPRALTVAFSPDGKHLATGGEDALVKLWDLTSSSPTVPVWVLQGHTDWVRSVTFSPDGRFLASASRDRTVKVWDVASGDQVLSLGGTEIPVYDVTFSPDSQHLAAALGNGRVMIADVASGKLLASLFTQQGVIWAVAYSPDGTRLATAGQFGIASVWDVRSGQELFGLTGHLDTIYSIVFSPDGTRLATGSDDGTTRIWDATTGQGILVLPGHTDTINSIAFSPDGRRLVTAATERGVRMYLLYLDDLLREATSHITRRLTNNECQQYLHLETCPAESSDFTLVQDTRGSSTQLRMFVTPAASSTSLHVGSLRVGYQPQGEVYQVELTVVIQDGQQRPVPGARTRITFTQPGALNNQVTSGVWNTDDQGEISKTHSPVHSGTYTFCIDNVEKPGWSYEKGQNTATCQQLTIP